MIFATGSNFFGQIGIGSRKREHLFLPVQFGCSDEVEIDNEIVEDVQCGNQFTIVLVKDGSLRFCGNVHGVVAPSLIPIQISLPVVCIQVACGRKHIVALMEKGVVMSWGVGYFGQLGHGDDSSWENPRMINALDMRRIGSKVVRVVCGGSHSGALTESNKVFMWGMNRGGQCGTNSKVDSVLEPRPIDCTEVGSSVKIVSLVCGRSHSALITSAGKVYVWGEATFGRLGLSDGKKKHSFPTELLSFRNIPIRSLASGDFHMLALGQDGSVYSWGYGCDGQTGQSSLLNVRTPRRIAFFDHLDVVSVECGASWSLAVTHSGELFVWGYGDGGWLGVRPLAEMPSMESDAATAESASQSCSATHFTSFDSRHNLICPQRVALLADWKVDRVRAGGAHMVVLCSGARNSEVVGDEKNCKESSAADVKTSEPRLLKSKDSFVQQNKQLKSASSFSLSTGYFGSEPRPSSAASSGVSSRLDAKEQRLSIDSVGTVTTNGAPSASSQSPMLSPDMDSQLISWSRNGKLDSLSAALQAGANVNAQDSAGNTPLIVACQTGHLAVCQLLVRFGANLNLANKKGNTALHYSFNYGYEALGAHLIASGADEFQVNHEGLTCYEGLTQTDLDLL